LDIVGNPTYPAGFKASDGDHLLLRMRLDTWVPPTTGNTKLVWQILFDTDPTADPFCDVDYVLQYDSKFDECIEFVEAIVGGPSLLDVTLKAHNTPHPPPWQGDIATYLRIIPLTSDGQELGSALYGDAFLDMAIPWADFAAITGLPMGDLSAFEAYLGTSNNQLHTGRDTAGEELLVPPASLVPEPATVSLLGLALLGARARRRKRV